MEFNGNLLCPLAPPQSRENIGSAGHFAVNFFGGAYNNSWDGWERRVNKISDNAESCLLRARWSLLLLERPQLPQKVSISTALFPPSFSTPLEKVLPSFIGSTSRSPSYLVPVYFVAHHTCLPTCTVLSVHAGRHVRCIPACFCFHG